MAFTYQSSAGRGQPVASFQSMLDAERARTSAMIAAAPAQTAAAVAGPGLADARTGGSLEGGDGGESPGESTGGSPNSTGIGGISVDAYGATANTTGIPNGVADAVGFGLSLATGIPGLSTAAVATNNAINNNAYAQANAFNVSTIDTNVDPNTTVSISSPDSDNGLDSNAATDTADSDDADAGAAGAAAAAAASGGDAGGDAGGSAGASSGSASGGSADGPPGAGGDADGGGGGGGVGGGGLAKGGQIGLADIKAYTAGGPTPPGIDDGFVESGVGDFILTAERTKQIGPAALKALSEGKAQIVMLKGGK